MIFGVGITIEKERIQRNTERQNESFDVLETYTTNLTTGGCDFD